MLDAGGDEGGAEPCAADVGVGGHSPQAPPARGTTGAWLAVQRGDAHQPLPVEGAEVDGVVEVVAGIERVLERLCRPKDPVAEGPDLIGRDRADQEALGSQAGRDAS